MSAHAQGEPRPDRDRARQDHGGRGGGRHRQDHRAGRPHRRAHQAPRARIGEIVAVTFSEKAAGELKLRLREELETARARKA